MGYAERPDFSPLHGPHSQSRLARFNRVCVRRELPALHERTRTFKYRRQEGRLLAVIATTETQRSVTFADIVAAAERIKPLARQSPVLTSRLFDDAAGTRACFKCENLQRGGAFKIRGAANFLLSLSPEERKRGVVTFSSGNHAQAVAIASAYLGVAATIVMPTDAPKAKVESTKAYGPTIIFFDRLKESGEEIAAGISKERAPVFFLSYDHLGFTGG